MEETIKRSLQQRDEHARCGLGAVSRVKDPPTVAASCRHLLELTHFRRSVPRRHLDSPSRLLGYRFPAPLRRLPRRAVVGVLRQPLCCLSVAACVLALVSLRTRPGRSGATLAPTMPSIAVIHPAPSGLDLRDPRSYGAGSDPAPNSNSDQILIWIEISIRIPTSIQFKLRSRFEPDPGSDSSYALKIY